MPGRMKRIRMTKRGRASSSGPAGGIIGGRNYGSRAVVELMVSSGEERAA